jgi:hypothetical protein
MLETPNADNPVDEGEWRSVLCCSEGFSDVVPDRNHAAGSFMDFCHISALTVARLQFKENPKKYQDTAKEWTKKYVLVAVFASD